MLRSIVLLTHVVRYVRAISHIRAEQPIGAISDGQDDLEDDWNRAEIVFDGRETDGLNEALELCLASGARPVQILGLQDSGTTFLKQLLERNFLQELNISCAHADWFGRGFYKHGNVEMLVRLEPWRRRYLEDYDFVGVAIIRNPISWLRSVKKAPYKLAACVEGHDWITRACHHPCPVGHTGHLSHIEADFRNLGTVWSNWTHTYQKLHQFGFKDSIIIRYEDLVQNTQLTLDRIGEVIGSKTKKRLHEVYEPSKPGGRPVDYDEALKKIQQREYLAEYTASELRQACNTVDVQLMQHYDFSADCQ